MYESEGELYKDYSKYFVSLYKWPQIKHKNKENKLYNNHLACSF